MTYRFTRFTVTLSPTTFVTCWVGTSSPAVSPQMIISSSFRSSWWRSCPYRPATVSCSHARLRNISQVSPVTPATAIPSETAVPSPGITDGRLDTIPAPVIRQTVPSATDWASASTVAPGFDARRSRM